MASDSSSISTRLIPKKQYVVPTTGSTIVVNSNGYVRLRLNPLSSLLSLTITFPDSPEDGDTVEISTTETVSDLTINGGTILNTPTNILSGGFLAYEYNVDSDEWFRTG